MTEDGIPTGESHTLPGEAKGRLARFRRARFRQWAGGVLPKTRWARILALEVLAAALSTVVSILENVITNEQHRKDTLIYGLITFVLLSAVMQAVGRAVSEKSSEERGQKLDRIDDKFTALLKVWTPKADPDDSPDAHASGPRPPRMPKPPDWMVARDEELEQAVAAVCGQPDETAALVTGLVGAGGFGKTMLAKQVCADERVLEYFADRVYFVTIGQDLVGRVAIAEKIAQVIRSITDQERSFGDDPGMAGDMLGSLLDQHPGQRTLLVLDDVWDSAQLQPFLRGGKQCMRLVTTRVLRTLPDGAAGVQVNPMNEDQARAVLEWKRSLPGEIAHDLALATGRWPLLLRLTNRVIAVLAQTGLEPAVAARDLLGRLGDEGPAALDDRRLRPDLDDEQSRWLVRETMRYATDSRLLEDEDQKRLAELAVFTPGEPVPIAAVIRLWQKTGPLDEIKSRQLCYVLRNLSLLTPNQENSGFVALHDVFYGYFLHELGKERATELSGVLTDAIIESLPPATPLSPEVPSPQAAWWELTGSADSPPDGDYLASHAIAFLLQAERIEPAETIVGDVRWVEARLRQQGSVVGPWTDCDRIIGRFPRSRARELARDLAQTAHLLAPTDPPYALAAVLHSRLGSLPAWHDQISARQAQLSGPVLRNRKDWPPPDLPDPALVRGVTTAHPGLLTGVATSRDGKRLATSATDEMLQIWDSATGNEVRTFRNSRQKDDNQAAVPAITPDDTLVASVGWGSGPVQIWNTIADSQTPIDTGRERGYSLAISADGAWLATARRDAEKVEIWDRAAGTLAASVTTGFTMMDLAFSRDSHWLAVVEGGAREANANRTAQVWDWAANARTAAIAVPIADGRTAVAIASDGSWLVTGNSGKLQIWSTVTGSQIATIATLHDVMAITIAPDEEWLATVGADGTLRIWDITSQTTFPIGSEDRQEPVGVLAIAPDGTWLAAVGSDGRLRIWDLVAGTQTMTGLVPRVKALAISPDGGLLVAVSSGGWLQVWDRLAESERLGRVPAAKAEAVSESSGTRVFALTMTAESLLVALTDGKDAVLVSSPDAEDVTITCPRGVRKLAFSPDGAWLATAGYWGEAQIWDRSTGVLATPIPVNQEVSVLAFSPDSTRLATANKEGTVQIWDRADGGEITAFAAHDFSVTALAFSPDGTWLATIGDDGVVQVWDWASRHAVAMMRTEGGLTSCTWLPENAGLIIGSENGLYYYEFDAGIPGQIPAVGLDWPVPSAKQARDASQEGVKRYYREIGRTLKGLPGF